MFFFASKAISLDNSKIFNKTIAGKLLNCECFSSNDNKQPAFSFMLLMTGLQNPFDSFQMNTFHYLFF